MSKLAVDPTNPDRVFFSSEDLIETQRRRKDVSATCSGAVHQDHHGLWISNDGRRIIEANDGGAPISIDGGKTWDWRFNVALAQIYRLGYDEQNPYRVCGGIQDNDSYCGPSDSLSPAWDRELAIGATSATTATARGFGRSRTIRLRFGTSA